MTQLFLAWIVSDTPGIVHVTHQGHVMKKSWQGNHCSNLFPSQRASNKYFDVFFFVRLHKLYNKQSCCLWRHSCDVKIMYCYIYIDIKVSLTRVFMCVWLTGGCAGSQSMRGWKLTWIFSLWWRHQMETFSALLALLEGNQAVFFRSSSSGFPSQRPVTLSFDVFFYLRLNKRLSKQSRHRLFATPWHSLWRHCHAVGSPLLVFINFHRDTFIRWRIRWSLVHVLHIPHHNYYFNQFRSIINS